MVGTLRAFVGRRRRGRSRAREGADMMLQLDPTIPMMTPKGSGYALFVVDYSQEHHLMWVVALDDGGEIWMFENPDVRVQSNFTLGRRADRAFGMRPGSAASAAFRQNGNGILPLGTTVNGASPRAPAS
jgi:hypothetical protein